ncbi:SDR family NAD(P)-dependent oxidoreductase [Burkholderia multivorans]|uniref:SDR family NAD(P)-dependent oxidoreductase n=1 Tax=Burkholderia multivorans TaxID=87883 RepID=UPI001C25115A|nr:SDR family NAD(P)-dependent oxidoreductase [Burkholderia multivorans]MBU9477678.1 SDR family oxidoreductase [Burkholderia multivorans]
MRLDDKVCVVTGGASGIGEAIIRAFAAAGARTVIMDVNLDQGLRLHEEVPGSSFVACNVADSAAVDKAFATIATEFGSIDVLVNNAGIVGKDEYQRVQSRREQQFAELTRDGKVETPLRATVNLTDDQWHAMLAVHLNGTFFCTRAALRHMELQRSGAIVNISSINGIDGGNGNPHYSAAKAGILGFTRAVAKDVIGQGIRVNAVAPGFIDTPLRDSISPSIQRAQIAATPIGRAARAEEVAQAVLFLATDASSYIVGQTLSPNGGYLTV